jgi:hypothetical protein
MAARSLPNQNHTQEQGTDVGKGQGVLQHSPIMENPWRLQFNDCRVTLYTSIAKHAQALGTKGFISSSTNG